MNEEEFNNTFAHLTGNPPLHWQWRLFRQFAQGELHEVIDLPTGLGKTMVMAIWLIARGVNKDVPRRLIYVVDRRTVVDQATDIAQLLAMRPITKWMHDHFDGLPPTISTLRGQLADNREWSRDPSRPAIIVGTVDLIGSALLFSGYRSGYKRRPLEAGLLGQDSLLVLDEAHLSKPFEKLVSSIAQFQHDHESPMQVIRMSATSGRLVGEKPPFRLEIDENGNLAGEDAEDVIVSERFAAKKRLTITTLGEKDDLKKKLAAAAIELAQKSDLIGKRIVVYVRSPDDATKIRDLIRDHEIKSEDTTGTKPKTVKPFAGSVEILTGTMRGLERDQLIETLILKRFLDGGVSPSDESNRLPVFLISTSAGEVGFDLNADHMVCDAAPLDSMIQRLGRVNRRGQGTAIVQVLAEKPSEKEADKKSGGEKQKIATASLNAIEALKKLPVAESLESDNRTVPILDASPRSLRDLNKPSDALSPPPTMVELTDILLDAWSMTSITERMPGRPEVAPWLRGIADDLPQTTIAWRAELDLFKGDPNPKKPFKAIFAKHRIRTHESLTANKRDVVAFLNGIKKKRPDLLNTRVVVKLARDLFVTTIGKLLDDPGILNTDPTLIVPATFGGLEKGMLHDEAIPPAPKPDDPPLKSLDVADEPGYEPREDASARLRVLIDRTDDGWKAMPLAGGAAIPADFNLEPSYSTSTLLIRAIESTDLRVRLVQPVAFDDEGAPIRSLVVLSPVADKAKKENQSLAEHVGAVETEAQRIADELGLKDPIRAALLFAAKWHDEGKKAAVWQSYVCNTDPDNPKGKSATTRDPKSLRGYRHEFGSLLRIHHSEQHKTDCTLPADHETRELALHLIATHHGFGRPHFDNPVERNFKSTQCDTIHTESIRRFARLQRKYGWWRLAWLENLLRCADALASADQDAEDDNAEESNNDSGGDA